MCIVSYNGISLPYSLVTDFRQEPVRDDLSDTDWHLTRYTISVQTIINTAYLNMFASGGSFTVGGDTFSNPLAAPDILVLLRKQLMTHRRGLSVNFNGLEMIPQAQANNKGTVDARNGPKPQYCVFNQLMENTFLMTFGIEANYWESTPVPGTADTAGNDVLYNRWTETVEIDNCNYTKRTRDGKYIIRSDNVDGITADYIRSQMGVVGVPPGFLRENSNYVISPDGLGIQYRVTDKEVFKLPPSPAFEADGEYLESAVNQGAVRHAQVRCRLRGSKTTNQAVLLTTSVAVCASKLFINGATLRPGGGGFGGAGTILESAVVGTGMYDNWVECSMRCRIPAKKLRVQGSTLLGGINLAVPGSEQGVAPTPPYQDRGTAGLLLQAANYYDPSLKATQIASNLNAVPNNPNTPVGFQFNLNNGFAPGTAGVKKEP